MDLNTECYGHGQIDIARRYCTAVMCDDMCAGLWQLSSLTSLRCLDVSGCINVDPYRALHFLRVGPCSWQQ